MYRSTNVRHAYCVFWQTSESYKYTHDVLNWEQYSNLWYLISTFIPSNSNNGVSTNFMSRYAFVDAVCSKRHFLFDMNIGNALCAPKMLLYIFGILLFFFDSVQHQNPIVAMHILIIENLTICLNTDKQNHIWTTEFGGKVYTLMTIDLCSNYLWAYYFYGIYLLANHHIMSNHFKYFAITIWKKIRHFF